jgi:DNA polymerase-3 subunit delta
MSESIRAIEYLAEPEARQPQPVCVVYGDETFLKRAAMRALRDVALGGGDGDFSLTTFDAEAKLRDVLDELSTMAMFGGGKRVVIVEEADDFVTAYRPELEDYVAKPRSHGILVLELKSFASNTRLFKAVAATGLAIDCSTPKAAQLTGWLKTWAKQAHRLTLDAQAADLLVELVGPELGLLDQELAKLAVAAPGGKASAELVSQFVGTWRTKTTWDMLDAALDGNPKEALVQLDRLLLAGEAPVALLAQIGSTLRRLAAATRLILQAEGEGRRIGLGDALTEAGIKGFVIAKSERQLRRLGRHRGDHLLGWVLEADLDLKGNSALPPRAILERLMVRLAAPSPQPARR